MITEYLIAGIMGIFLGILSTILGYLKQKDPTGFDLKPLFLRIPCGVCAAILIKYYGIAGLEALAVGLAITELNDSGIKLIMRRFFGKRLDLLNRDGTEKEEEK